MRLKQGVSTSHLKSAQATNRPSFPNACTFLLVPVLPFLPLTIITRRNSTSYQSSCYGPHSVPPTAASWSWAVSGLLSKTLRRTRPISCAQPEVAHMSAGRSATTPCGWPRFKMRSRGDVVSISEPKESDRHSAPRRQSLSRRSHDTVSYPSTNEAGHNSYTPQQYDSAAAYTPR